MPAFIRCLLVLCVVTAAATVCLAVPPDGQKRLLTPAPRRIAWLESASPATSAFRIDAEGPAAQVGRILAAELPRLFPGLTVSDHGQVVRLQLAAAPKVPSDWGWTWPDRNPDEAYLLSADSTGAQIVAQTPRGLLYGCQTLLQLVESAGAGQWRLPGVRIVDFPQLPFRAVHFCIFPNTELPAIRQAILLAARFKYNAVVIEPWASIQSKSHPETAYEHAYTAEQMRPVIELGRALHMEMIPMLNSWGHASGMRSTSFEHAVLDRYPQFRPLYEPDGWSFCLKNPEVYRHLFDRYDELLSLFGPGKYFHAGMDEAWGHLGPVKDNSCRGDDPRGLLIDHLTKLHGYFAQRNRRVIMWHDMFIQRDHPTLGRLSPAGSVPPVNTHLALDQLPKDVIIAAWNYSDPREWPVPKYFHDKGYPVVVSPWKNRRNTVALCDLAKKYDLFGLLATTWDSLDVALPSVAQAGVLAWTDKGYDVGLVPFDHWVAAIRQFPIDRLPGLEASLRR